MKIISPTLPRSPHFKQAEFAKDQEEYITMPAAIIPYSDNSVGIITRYQLSFIERLRVLFTGNLWMELMTAGSPQPQRLIANEPTFKMIATDSIKSM